MALRLRHDQKRASQAGKTITTIWKIRCGPWFAKRLLLEMGGVSQTEIARRVSGVAATMGSDRPHGLIVETIYGDIALEIDNHLSGHAFQPEYKYTDAETG